MEETIAKIVLAGGLLGLIYLVIKKIPVLAQLPENQTVFSNQGITVQLRKVAEKMPFARSFSLNIYLQRILSKTKILTMRFEGKISSWLQDLRTKAQKKQELTDNYWEELKKSTLQKVIRKRKTKELIQAETTSPEDRIVPPQ